MMYGEHGVQAVRRRLIGADPDRCLPVDSFCISLRTSMFELGARHRRTPHKIGCFSLLEILQYRGTLLTLYGSACLRLAPVPLQWRVELVTHAPEVGSCLRLIDFCISQLQD